MDKREFIEAVLGRKLTEKELWLWELVDKLPPGQRPVIDTGGVRWRRIRLPDDDR